MGTRALKVLPYTLCNGKGPRYWPAGWKTTAIEKVRAGGHLCWMTKRGVGHSDKTANGVSQVDKNLKGGVLKRKLVPKKTWNRTCRAILI